MSLLLSDAARQKLLEPRGRPASTKYAHAHFTLSVPGSEDSSRESSPARSIKDTISSTNNTRYPSSALRSNQYDIYPDELSASKTASEEKVVDKLTPGRLPMDVYEATLPWWRAAIRRRVVESVKWESKVIARLQNVIRTPWLDAYFVYTSSLGTHTFFMILLPAFFFFGHNEMGRGLILILAMGVYLSSFVKDLVCSPRPFAPPVTRLTIGTHHLEYGFPSTHSTNSVSIALFFFAHAHRLASIIAPSTPTSTPSNSTSSLPTLAEPFISPNLFTLITIIISIYTFSIVFGRIYTAMHSFTDCAVGVTIGTVIWWAESSWSGIPFVLTPTNPLYHLFSLLWPSTLSNAGTYILHLGKGLGGGQWVEGWVQRGGWEVPLILIPLCLLAVNQHPQPVDDCPCFEDAVAFNSVLLGALVGSWAVNFSGLRMDIASTGIMPGSGWVSSELGNWVQVERTVWDVVIWWSFAALKMTVGILAIFIWRLLAKSTFHLILPPTFRILARGFSLPNRRFYTPATDYKSVPSEFSGPSGIHAIPSVIDLPSSGQVGFEVGGIGSGVGGVYGGNEIKMRAVGASTEEKGGKAGTVIDPRQGKGREGKDGQLVKHYDADVLTKVVVYVGIAVLSCEVLPATFEVLGWGIRSSM